MPTALSWTEVRRATADVGALVAFRASAVRGRPRLGASVALGLIVGLTILCAWLPAYLPGSARSVMPSALRSAEDAVLLLPSAYLGVLVIAIVAAASSGGGRELLSRDQGVAFPVSPTTDHLGALAMAPLNIAWLMQTWVVLAWTAFAVGPDRLWAAQVPVLLWVTLATAVAQIAAWTVEVMRTDARGLWLARALVTGLGLTVAVLIATDSLVAALDRSPTLSILLAALAGARGDWMPWTVTVLVLLALTVLAVVTGAVAAHVLAGRPRREESRLETASYARRPHPRSDLAAVVRADRAGVWRSVPLRRGFGVLALLPGLVALASGLEWEMVGILPGLVASGGALLFGVNAWCLDGRGVLWRESLPLAPRVAFAARVIVLVEVLLVAVAMTLLLAALRAGVPTSVEIAAVGSATVVVTGQVVSGSLRWSVRRPFAVDLRSPRATPAPPLTMVGYSTRLALVTTLTGMLFVSASRTPSWEYPVALALPFVLLSLLRLVRTAEAWADPVTRARVVSTVAS